MKVKNVSAGEIFLKDLRIIKQAQNENRQGEDQYLAPGASVYLPNTDPVIRSAYKGDLKKWRDAGVIALEDTDTLAANGSPGDTIVLTHDFGLPPVVYILKQVGPTWVDATGTVDVVHNAAFTTTTITNTTLGALTFFIRLM